MQTIFKCLMVMSAILLLTRTEVNAHEKREVAVNYQWVVGFIHEPAFAGELNGIDLSVSDASGRPVEGLEETLHSEVLNPDRSQSLRLSLENRYGKPGRYGAYFIPAEAGDYVFHISGFIEGKPVNEYFESGPTTFGAVRSPISFPKGGE